MKAYDHITATYYLLAERLLRKRADALQASASTSAMAAEKEDMKPALSPLALSPRFAVECSVARFVIVHDSEAVNSVLFPIMFSVCPSVPLLFFPTLSHLSTSLPFRSPFYPHMPIGKVWIYCLLFVCYFVCTVTDFLARIKLAVSNFARWFGASWAGNLSFEELCSLRSPKSDKLAHSRKYCR